MASIIRQLLEQGANTDTADEIGSAVEGLLQAGYTFMPVENMFILFDTAAWALARRLGVTPRELLQRRFDKMPTDEEWGEKLLPALDAQEREDPLLRPNDPTRFL
jgi:hypothetical protein